MTRILFFIFTCYFVPFLAHAQYSFSGTVEDKETGEKLAGALVVLSEAKKTEVTDAYGRYYFKLQAGKYNCRLQMLGYHPLDTLMDLQKDTLLTFKLTASPVMLDAVSVRSSRYIPGSSQASDIVQISRKDLLNKGSFFLSEPDALKALQKLPGIAEGSEGSAGLNVRGGSHDQNLILIDGVPLYNAFHLFSFLSVLNPESIQSIELMKGGVPARYGGRLSSVLNIHLREGNKFERGGKYTISPLASSLLLEGPIVSEKASYLFSARRSWLDMFQKITNAAIPEFGFYDITAKAHVNLNPDNSLFFSVYNNQDKFLDDAEYTDERFGFKWGNFTSIVRWNKQISQKTFSQLSASYNRYLSSQERVSLENNNYSTKSELKETALQFQLEHHPVWIDEIRVGGQAGTLHSQPMISTMPGMQENNEDTAATWKGAVTGAVFAELQSKVFSRTLVQTGLRYEGFWQQGATQGTISPRVSIRHSLGRQWSIHGHFIRMSQLIHLLTQSTMGQPLDLWVNATERIPIQKANQISLGIEKSYSDRLKFGVDFYWKEMKNVIAYKEGLTFLQNSRNSWEELVTIGKGKAYGIETLASYNTARHSVEMAYTWSRSFRQFEELNLGRPFPFKYDRPHNISLSYSGLLGKRSIISASWTMQSGHTITLPETSYKGLAPPLFEEESSKAPYFQNLFFTEKLNAYRLPTHHRLDLSFRRTNKKKSRAAQQWTFSVYNLYNRLNPYFIFEAKGKLKAYALFPLIPSVSYSREF